MTNLFIENEGDMEYGIEHMITLSKLKGRKNITLGFPSAALYKIFMTNLHQNMLDDNDVPVFLDLEATIVLPPWEKYDE